MQRDPFEVFDVGNDELELGDSVAVVKSGAMLGFMPTSMLRTMTPENLELVGELQKQVMQIRDAQARVDHLVEHARETGMSWSSIGWCTGLTGEGARLKWGERE